MDMTFQKHFLQVWDTYFPGAELPIAFYYTGDPEQAARAPSSGPHCIICELAKVRRGQSLAFDVDAVQCGGARRYLGFDPEIRPKFEYFLSCGIPGEMEGERYKQSPELVRQVMQRHPPFEAPGRYIVFKRWDALDENDEPLAVIFFARPDVLSGLFTWANFDALEPAVIAPFASGCASIVYHAFQERDAQHPRAILGMFDVSARPCVSPDELTFSVPWKKFVGMIENMPETFLITASWKKVQARIE